MKFSKVLCLLLTLTLLLSGCSVSNGETRGNSTGNITNRGYVATDGTSIFYRLGNSIQRENSDGSATPILNCEAESLNCYDGLLFFVNLSDSARIYSVNPDGSQPVSLCDISAWYLTAVDGWLYFADRGSEGGIYRMRTDGSDLTRISDAIAQYLNVTGGWVYYTDLFNSGIHRIDLNGNRHTQLSDHESASLCVSGKKAYFRSYTDIGIYSMNANGSDTVRLSPMGAGALNLHQTQLYFSVYNDKTYQMPPAGGEPTAIYYERAMTINAAGDWLFFHNIDCTRMVRYNIQTEETSVVDVSTPS